MGSRIPAGDVHLDDIYSCRHGAYALRVAQRPELGKFPAAAAIPFPLVRPHKLSLLHATLLRFSHFITMTKKYIFKFQLLI